MLEGGKQGQEGREERKGKNQVSLTIRQQEGEEV